MRRLAVPGAAVLLLGFPATAAPATVTLNQACARTLETLLSTGGTAGSTVVAGPRFAAGSRVVDATDSTQSCV